jgi:hypothetical protein
VNIVPLTVLDEGTAQVVEHLPKGRKEGRKGRREGKKEGKKEGKWNSRVPYVFMKCIGGDEHNIPSTSHLIFRALFLLLNMSKIYTHLPSG